MANKIYLHGETEITFKSSGGTVAFSPASVANNAGRISAQADLGSAARSRLYRWRAKSKCQATPTLGALIRIYLVCADDTTDLDGNAGTADAAFATEALLKNHQYIGNIIIDVAGTGDQKASSMGTIEIASRYVSVVFWNASGATLDATGSNHQFTLVPVPDEIQ